MGTAGGMMATDPERKGRCYQLSAVAVVNGVDIDLPPAAENVRLVHGWPVLRGGPAKGRRYGHAWVEYELPNLPVVTNGVEVQLAPTLMVWDAVRMTHWLAIVYYMGGKIDPDHCTRYTSAKARRMLLETKVYGWWADPPEGMEIDEEDPEDERTSETESQTSP